MTTGDITLMTNSDRHLLNLTQDNSSFSKELPGMQLAWDSTSLGQFKECPYKYYLGHILGYQPKGIADPLRFGLAFHKCQEEYSKFRAQGENYETALRNVTRYALEITGERNEAGEFTPWTVDDKRRDRTALVRAVIWHIEYFKDDGSETVILQSGKPAVELTFKFDLFGKKTKLQEELWLCGHLDKVDIIQGRTWVKDYKTTTSTLYSSFFEKFTPDNQMSLYTVAAKVVFGIDAAGVMIDGIGLLTHAARFGRGEAIRTPGMIEEWIEDTMSIIEFAEHCATKQSWPMNDMSCDKFGGCKYRSICSADPSVRQSYLEGNFKRRVWDPLIPRN